MLAAYRGAEGTGIVQQPAAMRNASYLFFDAFYNPVRRHAFVFGVTPVVIRRNVAESTGGEARRVRPARWCPTNRWGQLFRPRRMYS